MSKLVLDFIDGVKVSIRLIDGVRVSVILYRWCQS